MFDRVLLDKNSTLLAADKPFLEILADKPPCSGRSTVESPDGSSVTTNSFNSLASCNCAAPSGGLGAMQPPPALELPTPEFLHPPHFYQDLSPESCVVEAAGAWPPHEPMEFDPLPDALLSQSSSFASSNGSSRCISRGLRAVAQHGGCYA
uniref:Predicted protein n=1 Tax=Hordeum vulgare subsp. vulgare TaxID=112509 RepID=F2EKK6_HORVV|nr:predicted protein [Hordeum vulgare subsp. vulgare]